MNDSTLICFMFYFLVASRVNVAVRKLPVVECNEPVLATVEVDPHHRFRPFYVRLHRCQGSWKQDSPKTKRCIPTGQEDIEIRVFSLERESFEIRTMYNHTSCGAECTTGSPEKCNLRVEKWSEENCRCDCLYIDAPPSDNVMKEKKGFRWNKHICNYQCNRSPAGCSRKKELDKEVCSCVCKPYYKHRCDQKKKKLDPNTCECLKAHASHGMSPSSFTYLLIVTIPIALAVLVLFTLIFCYRRGKCKQANLQQPQKLQMTPDLSTVTITESERSSDCQGPEGQVNLYCYETGV